MPLIRVFSGDYTCPTCEDEFRAKGVPEKGLVCPSCDVDLVEADEDSEEDSEGD